MTSIDDLFRRPNAAPKRKLENPDSSFLRGHKAAKVSDGASPHTLSHARSNGRTAYVEEEPEENASAAQAEDDDDDIEAGPALPPDDDDEGDVDEDDEGRFFGGGVSKQGQRALDYIDDLEDPEAAEETIDLNWLKRTTLQFEKKINKNAELRAKYEDDPMKFVGSEADLDTAIKGLALLSEHQELYGSFVKSGCVGSLVGLLAHENTDIAIAVCELLVELTDEEIVQYGEPWELLVDAVLEADGIDLLVSNLGRLDENSETDRAGVYHVLNVIENMTIPPGYASKVGESVKLLKWLKGRIQTPDAGARAQVGQNRVYAAEILASLQQFASNSRPKFAVVDGIDVLLQLLSAYRKRDPEKGSEEEEFVENLFDCLAAAVRDSDCVTKFLEGEGMELCLIMMKEGKLSKQRSLRILDHALGGGQGAVVGEKLVECAGLKVLFSLFMRKGKHNQETIEHIIGMFASLLRYLPDESPARIRTLSKFVEDDYAKIIKIMELRQIYASRVNAVNERIEKEKTEYTEEGAETMADEWQSLRFEAGLFAMQTLDVALTWLVAEDDGARKEIMQLFGTQGLDGQVILRDSLQEQLAGIDDHDRGEDTKEMLEALVGCLVDQ